MERAARQHPCFQEEAHGLCGRVHLPVAPRCNLKCSYCNRRYDCVNESRPGVTSAVLSPAQADRYLGGVLAREPRITVVGIAGPGDPFANAEQTLETLRRVRQSFPDLLLCVSTNGLGLPAHLDRVSAVGVTHVTVTVNAVDPGVGEKLCSRVLDGKVVYRGRRGAELLLERQLAALRGLKERGVVVKVNTVVVPGLNDRHVPEVARTVAELGADVMNAIPLIPAAGTFLEGVREPTPFEMEAVREEAGRYLPQTRHCRRCRADAAGLLGEDRSGELRSWLARCSEAVELRTDGRPYVRFGLEGA